MSKPSKSDAQKIINAAKSVIDILEINKLTDRALATKFLNDAIKNQYTIIIVE